MDPLRAALAAWLDPQVGGSIVLIVMVVLTAVNTLGVSTTSFLAIVGAASLALEDSLPYPPMRVERHAPKPAAVE